MYKDYYYDKELGMYNINNRFYLPDINRFLIPDSVGNIDIKDIGNLNLYSYSNNNPINECYKDKLDESKPSNSTVNTTTPSRTVLAPKVILDKVNNESYYILFDYSYAIFEGTINGYRELNNKNSLSLLNKVGNILSIFDYFSDLYKSYNDNFVNGQYMGAERETRFVIDAIYISGCTIASSMVANAVTTGVASLLSGCLGTGVAAALGSAAIGVLAGIVVIGLLYLIFEKTGILEEIKKWGSKKWTEITGLRP